jgi:hypothetical protein
MNSIVLACHCRHRYCYYYYFRAGGGDSSGTRKLGVGGALPGLLGGPSAPAPAKRKSAIGYQ